MRTSVDEQLARVKPGTFRHEVLECARRFKTAWVELGGQLVRVRREGNWREWGYSSFESYCAKELHLKRATAEKLVLSYGFLEKHERPMVASGGAPESAPPAFEVVSVLAEAEERGQLGPEDYKTLRDEIWAPHKAPQAVARELRARFPAPAPAPQPPETQMRRLAAVARRLAGEMRGCRQIPRALAERAAELANDVEELASDL